jgi:Trk-type K+ transport system membrane component
VSARTAGFNTIDLNAMVPASLLLMIALMWIGASPGSTGGGIRTTTFALAVLRIINSINGKKRVEIYMKEISGESFKKAFSVIFISVVVIMTSSFLVAIFDPEMDLIKIVFECFSAFGTVGLSLGITSSLSTMSKFIIILTMFFGRVSMLTLLIAIFYRLRNSAYRYPSEDVLTN